MFATVRSPLMPRPICGPSASQGRSIWTTTVWKTLGLGVLAAVGVLAQPQAAIAQSDNADVCLYYTSPEKLDKSFNEMAFTGASTSGVPFREFLPANPDAYPALITQEAPGCPLNIAIGFMWADAVADAARANPSRNFVIIDSVIDLPNVRSITFAEHEGSYLAGVAAGKSTTSGTVAFIGGVDAPLIRRFQTGFEQGVKSVHSDATVLSAYLGSFANPFKGSETAADLIEAGADVLFAAAGGSGLGVLATAADANKKAIGVDSNQNFLYPGAVLTSMLKRVDVAVQDTMTAAATESFAAGHQVLDLAAGGVGLAVDRFNDSIWTPDVAAAVNAADQAIRSGQVRITTSDSNS